MSLKDKLTEAQALNKTIHDALNATARLSSEISAELQGDFDLEDGKAVLHEFIEIAYICKHFAARVDLAMMISRER